MGITIHYKIEFDGSAKELTSKLEKIKNKCRDLPFEEVGDVKNKVITESIRDRYNYLQNITFHPNNSEENLRNRDKELENMGVSIWTMIEASNFYDKRNKNQNIVLLSLLPGKGCEYSDLNFYEIPNHKFNCRSFCKTQYSENFVKDHLLVIKLLDILKEEGFKVEVSDEGKYWETRDIKVLAENINLSTKMLISVFEKLKEQFKGTDTRIESNIENSKNFIKIN
jgi:hypothetical protein